MPKLTVKIYVCKNACGVISTSNEHPCYKCGGELVSAEEKE